MAIKNGTRQSWSTRPRIRFHVSDDGSSILDQSGTTVAFGLINGPRWVSEEFAKRLNNTGDVLYYFRANDLDELYFETITIIGREGKF